MIEVQVGDTIVEFPDGTSQDVMRSALQKKFGGGGQEPSVGTPQEEAAAARERAAIRQREAVQPPGGRASGALSAFPGQALQALGDVGQRARAASMQLAEGDPNAPMGDIFGMATMGIGGSPAGLARALTPQAAARIETGVTAIPRAIDAGPFGQSVATRYGRTPERAQEALGQIQRAGEAAGGTADPEALGGVIRNALAKRGDKVSPRLSNLTNPKLGDADIIDLVYGMARTGSQTDTVALAQLRKFVPAKHREGLQEALIQKLGQGPEGQFNPEKFVTEWDRLSDRMKNVLFSSEDLRRHLDNIASVSREVPALQGLEARPISKSRLYGLSFAAGHMMGGTPGGALAVLGTMIPLNIMGRALAKPATAASVSHWARAYQRMIQTPGPQALSLFNIATRNLNNNLGTDVNPEEVLRGGSQ